MREKQNQTGGSIRCMLKDFLFPRRCPFCDRPIGYREYCSECESQLTSIMHAPPRLTEDSHRLFGLESAAAVFLYKNAAADAIKQMKYNAHPWYGREFGMRIAKKLYGCEFYCRRGIIGMRPGEWTVAPYDGVIPIPSTHKRSYDSTREIARAVAEALRKPLWTDVLVKKEGCRPQAGLDRQERLVNAVGTMLVKNAAEVEGKTILLVDDVITTGATISEAASVLLRAGAYGVYAVCAAASEEEDKTNNKELG